MARTRNQLASARRFAARLPHGNILVLTAVFLVVLVAMVAFGVDVGYMVNVRTEIQRTTDVAALAGAGELVNGVGPARAEAIEFLGQNKVGGRTLGQSNAVIDFGHWNYNSRTFTVSANVPNAIRVQTTDNAQPLFFGRVLGTNTFDTKATAVATYQPRDIVLVLDYSGSMCFDSQFCSIDKLGKSTVEGYIQKMYQELGSPAFGNFTFKPAPYGNLLTPNAAIKAHMGVNNMPYPMPGGSWDEFITYVKLDSDVGKAGYRNCYGFLNLLNYVQARRPSYEDTPLLWTLSEQPVTAMKDAVDVFLSFLEDHSTDDRVGLSIYSYSDNNAILEQALTKQYSLVSTKVRQRQAGHYVGGTNISAGMVKGREELQNNARVGASKMMLLMTDGMATLPTGNTAQDKQKVIDEAYLCAAARIPVITIALGAEADTALMQQVADITKGACFIVEGGKNINQVKAELEAVFGKVAADRPLKLVK